MTWLELTSTLRDLGVKEEELPTTSLFNERAFYGCRVFGAKFVVFQFDRLERLDLYVFDREADAAAFVFDGYKYLLRLQGDCRLRDVENRKLSAEAASPKPEQFGGSRLQSL